MNAYVLSASVLPPSANAVGERLEEMVFRASHKAIESAAVSQRQIDHVTLGACDELDGRPISSMLMAGPAGAYLTDEIKVTDSGASALCLAYARLLSGEFDLGLVVSWCKSSKTSLESVMNARLDPFFNRFLGVGGIAADAMFAQAASEEFGVTEDEVNQRVNAAYERAQLNPRGMRHGVLSERDIASSPYEALPVRSAHRAPLTDGAVSMVLASSRFVERNSHCVPLARIAGAGWASDSYRLDKARLSGMRSARLAWATAMRHAGIGGAADLDAVELESPTGFHEAAYVRAFGLTKPEALSPSGGSFAQNPIFCSGLVNAAEAVLQVSGNAGPVQRTGAKRAAAHSCHGAAQQGNVVVVFESMGAAR